MELQQTTRINVTQHEDFTECTETKTGRFAKSGASQQVLAISLKPVQHRPKRNWLLQQFHGSPVHAA
jgi:hypothetical protein